SAHWPGSALPPGRFPRSIFPCIEDSCLPSCCFISRELTAFHLPYTISHTGFLLFVVADPQRRRLLVIYLHPVLNQLFHQLRSGFIQRRGWFIQQQQTGI